MRYIAIAAAFGTLLLVGCIDSESPVATEPPAVSLTQGFGMSIAIHPALGSDISDEDIKRLSHARLMWRIEADEIVSSAHDWTDADVAIREALRGHRPIDEQYQREQTAAGIMLHAFLLHGPQTPESLAALAFYTRLLVENGSPEAGLIASALEHLDGFLGSDRIAEYAASAAQSAERLAGSRMACRGCPYERLVNRLPEEAQEQMEGNAASILYNIGRLRKLAGLDA